MTDREFLWVLLGMHSDLSTVDVTKVKERIEQQLKDGEPPKKAPHQPWPGHVLSK